MAENTPVTVLTGFLGAGKTTLLNHLLRDPALARTAVLVNEFGEIGLDHLLVRPVSDTTVLLNAGCLCCTVRGDLSRALREMLPRSRRDEITRIIIETTGLADPIPILGTLMGDPVVASSYRLDGVVTVIDAVNGRRNLARHHEAQRQVAVADRLVLTKTDLAEADGLLRDLRDLNPAAPVIEAPQGAVDPALLLQAGPFDAAGRSADVRHWLDHAAFDAADHHHGHDPNRHDARIAAFCLGFAHPLALPDIWAAMGALIAAHGERLLRVKGLLHVQGEDRPVALHAAGHLLHLPVRLAAWPDNDPRTSRLVFITDDLPRSEIVASLRALGATS